MPGMLLFPYPPDIKGRVMHMIAILMILLAFVLGGFHVVDLYDRERLLTRHFGDLRKAAQLINESYGPDIASCSYIEEPDDLDRLVHALVTVESFATTKLERFVENALVRTALALSVAVPDFSLGMGQIRPSTVEKALANSGRGSLLEPSHSLQMRYSLLEVCGNLRLARLVVVDIMEEQRLSSTRFDRQTVTNVAKKYNGHVEASSLASGFSHAVYNEVVFNLFQLYRFQSLASTRIGIDQSK